VAGWKIHEHLYKWRFVAGEIIELNGELSIATVDYRMVVDFKA
jgi:hypothetical protein